MTGVTLLHHRPSKRMMVLRFRVVLRGGMVDGGGTLLHHRPSKRMMVLRFRVVLCGGIADDGGNFAAPSPIKTDDGTAVSRRIVWWNGGWRG